MIEHRWQETLPQAVRYQSRVVAEPGTLWHWQQANSKITAAEAISDLMIDDDCNCKMDGCTSCRPLPSEEWAAQAQHVLELNREALQHFRDGVAANSYRTPVEPPNLAANMELLTALRSLIRLAKVQAGWLAMRGDVQGAAAAVAEIIDAGRLVIDSDGMIVDYLIGIGFVGAGTWSADELLDRHRLPHESLELLLTAIAKLDFPRAIANTTRSELNRWALPKLERFERELRQQGPSGYFELFSDDPTGEFSWREEQLRFVLEDHPALLDADEVAQQLAWVGAECVAECENREPGDVIREQMAAFRERFDRFHAVWPAEFNHQIYDLSEPPQTEVDRIIRDHLCENNASLKPIPEDRLQAAREALREVVNPLGLAVFDQLVGMSSQHLLHFPLMPQVAGLWRRIESLQRSTFTSRLSELRRRWKRSWSDRRRLRKQRG